MRYGISRTYVGAMPIRNHLGILYAIYFPDRQKLRNLLILTCILAFKEG